MSIICNNYLYSKVNSCYKYYDLLSKSVFMTNSVIPHFITKPEREQDKVQPGIGDLGLAGRDLRLDDRRPRPSRPLHQRE
jgi:hypothetical protein